MPSPLTLITAASGVAAIVAFVISLHGKEIREHTLAQRAAIGLVTLMLVLATVVVMRSRESSAGIGYDATSGHKYTVKEITDRAESGNTDAQIDLADMFYNGEGVTRSYSRSLYWYEQAASSGATRAATQLGWMYTRGLGTKLDRAQAAKWFRKAASAGDARAQNYLGYAYIRGWGVPVDYASARQWLSKSATQNDRVDLYNYGLVLEQGLGGPQDADAAMSFYRRSAALGYADARTAILRLQGK